MSGIWKTAGHRKKQAEIWESGVIVMFMWGTFSVQDYFVVIQWVHSVHLSKNGL